jgi:hypothetical protein
LASNGSFSNVNVKVASLSARTIKGTVSASRALAGENGARERLAAAAATISRFMTNPVVVDFL